MLINIAGSDDLSLAEVEEAASMIQQQAHEDAYIVWGATHDSSLHDRVRVSVVAVGLGLD